MTFPRAHWPQIYSTNPLERLNAEIKRRTNVVGIFPNDASITRLVGAPEFDTSTPFSRHFEGWGLYESSTYTGLS
jgi:putative transposase